MKSIGNIVGVFGFAALVAFLVYAEMPALKSSGPPAPSVDSNPESDHGIGASIPVTMTPPAASEANTQNRQTEPPPKSLVFHVQVLLKRRGYDPGPIDGIVGEKTKQSILAFQSSAHLVADGLVTKELLKQLDSTPNGEPDVSGKP